MSVLRNTKYKCAAKGIVWLACPTLLRVEGQLDTCEFFSLFLSIIILTCHSKYSGAMPEGQDFKLFIGAEKANEFKILFSNWVHTIYCKPSSTIW